MRQRLVRLSTGWMVCRMLEKSISSSRSADSRNGAVAVLSLQEMVAEVVLSAASAGCDRCFSTAWIKSGSKAPAMRQCLHAAATSPTTPACCASQAAKLPAVVPCETRTLMLHRTPERCTDRLKDLLTCSRVRSRSDCSVLSWDCCRSRGNAVNTCKTAHQHTQQQGQVRNRRRTNVS